MSSINVVQTENLNNGQWPDLFSFEETPQSNEVLYFVIDGTQDYFNTRQQIINKSNRIFTDKTEAKMVSGSTVALNFFSTTSPKTRATKSGIVSSSIDEYRQGTEISLVKHLVEGTYKLTAGTAGHLIDPKSIGIGESNDLTGNEFFQELSLFNPVEFISLQTDKPIEEIITFPIVTKNVDQRENYILNGVIEPFPIRAVISYFSINFPFEPHGVSANFGNGNPYLRSSSDETESIYDFQPLRANKKPFLDGGEPLTMQNDEGTETVEVGPNLPYIDTDQNVIVPYDDTLYTRGDILQSTRPYESDLLSVIKRMEPEGMSYLMQDQLSGKTGFVYNNSIQGVDSIAYGGLVR